MYSVSMDQVKRFSRYHRLLKEAKEHLSPVLQKKIEILGLISLFLSPIIQK